MFRFLATKQFWKWLGIVVGGLLVLLVVADLFMVWWVDSRLQAKIAEIRAAGDPASIADLAPEPIPDDQNAAAILERIAPQLNAFSKDQWEFWDTPTGKALNLAEQRGEPPKKEQIEAIRSILAKYPEIDQALAEAAACDQYPSRLDYSLGPNELIDLMIERGPTIRNAARFQRWQGLVLTTDGQTEEAVRRGVQLLKLARLHDAEPVLVNYLIGLAVRGIAVESLYDALASGPVSPEVHAALEDELALHEDPQRFVQALKTERAYSISTARDGGLFPRVAEVPSLVQKLTGWPLKSSFVDALEWYDTNLELAARPWHEIKGQIGRVEKGSLRTDHGIMADLLLPALEAAYDAEARTTATLRALRIFNALRRYEEEVGAEAPGLEALNFLPRDATIDPFSGQPLLLKHTDDGWIIYSVMENGVDDGGDFVELKDYGLAPRTYRETE